jgi:hypothetical protein
LLNIFERKTYTNIFEIRLCKDIFDKYVSKFGTTKRRRFHKRNRF